MQLHQRRHVGQRGRLQQQQQCCPSGANANFYCADEQSSGTSSSSSDDDGVSGSEGERCSCFLTADQEQELLGCKAAISSRRSRVLARVLARSDELSVPAAPSELSSPLSSSSWSSFSSASASDEVVGLITGTFVVNDQLEEEDSDAEDDDDDDDYHEEVRLPPSSNVFRPRVSTMPSISSPSPPHRYCWL